MCWPRSTKPLTKAARWGPDHPIAWCHKFEGGRIWYTALGHTQENYSEPLFLQHILGGIHVAVGVKGELISAPMKFQSPADMELGQEDALYLVGWGRTTAVAIKP